MLGRIIIKSLNKEIYFFLHLEAKKRGQVEKMYFIFPFIVFFLIVCFRKGKEQIRESRSISVIKVSE